MYLQPVFQNSSEVVGHRGFGGSVGLLAYSVQLMDWGYWSSLAAESVPAGCPEKLRQVVEVPGLLTLYGGPREWGGLPGGLPFTSWASLYIGSLCFSEVVVDRRVWEQRGTVALKAPLMGCRSLFLRVYFWSRCSVAESICLLQLMILERLGVNSLSVSTFNNM